MKFRFFSALLAFLLTSMTSGAALAAVDSYMGDAAIYSAQGTTGFKPNVLIIIDNSKATEFIASGVAYDSTHTYANQGYEPWAIYVGDNQGQFNNTVFTSAHETPETALTDLPCDIDAVYNSLIESGTYSGSGIANYPNLSNGGECATGPKGATYALGNYLNYVNATPESSEDVIVSHDYVTRKGNSGNTVTESGRKFLLTSTHVAASDNEPGTLDTDWQSYWNLLASDDPRSTTEWATGTSYSVSADFAGQTQRQIVYEAVSNVIEGTRFAVNFAVMTYGDMNHGGKIVNEMTDLEDDSDFATFLTRIPGSGHASSEPVLSSNTGRPQAEALYDAGYYFGATYSPVKIASRIPNSIKKDCYNNIIFITNGLSNGDGGSSSTVWQIGDADGDLWPGEVTKQAAVYGEGSHYLDDVALHLQENYGITTHMLLAFQGHDELVERTAFNGNGEYYNVYDANGLHKAMIELLTNVVADVDSSFVAPVVPTSPENRTYSGERVYLGFFNPVTQKPWQGNLKKFGINSSNQIIDSDSPPKVATEDNGNFKADSISWWNNIEDAGIVDEGGVGQVLLDRISARNIYTYNGSSATKVLTNSDHEFSTDNSWITSSLLGVADSTEREGLINFIHGYDSFDDDRDGTYGDPINGEKRPWIMGDILHSKPKIVNYNTYEFSYANESAVSGGECTYNKTVIFVGANDGMLHAFRDCDGEELWSFVPPDLLGNLKYLREAGHKIFVDGTPTAYIYDADNDGNIEAGDKVILLFGLRRGGDAYYALDVSNPEAPEYLWKIDSNTAGFSEMGQSWSEPTLGKVKYNSGFGTDVVKVVAFIGAGYDNDNEDGRFGNTQGFTDAPVVIPTSDAGPEARTSAGTEVLTIGEELSGSPQKGRGVYAFEVATLNSSGVPTIATSPIKVWDFTFTDSGSDTLSYNRRQLNYSIPSDVAAVDTDYDGFTDRLYVGDTGGRIWRISAHYPGTYPDDSLKNRPYARARINTTDPWFGKIIFDANSAPVVNATDKGRKFFYKPSLTLEKGGTYNIYFGSGDRAHPLNTGVIDRMYGLIDRGQITSEAIDEDDMVDVTENDLQESSGTSVESILTDLSDTSKYGWYIKLDQNSGEKVLASPLAFNKVAYYTTYAPLETTANSCTPGNLGVSRLYAVDYKTGEAVLNFNGTNDSQSTDNNSRALSKHGKVLRRADRSIELGVGIPSGIVVLMPPSGEAKLLIGCGGGLCSEDPALGGTIIPIYWMAW